MKKRGKSSIYSALHMPISLKLLAFFIGIGASLVFINIIAIFEKRTQERHSTSISQKKLQDILGTNIFIGELPQEHKTQKINQNIDYWKNVVQSKPDFRDAYIILSILSFNKKNCQDAKYYIQKAHDLDPNHTFLKGILPHIKNCS
ncbi:MAG: hypothetical protein N3A54_02395 [Patescibacteria group bacterium]|nr:hypothetical protein [Patescibacteria group bacterium]